MNLLIPALFKINESQKMRIIK